MAFLSIFSMLTYPQAYTPVTDAVAGIFSDFMGNSDSSASMGHLSLIETLSKAVKDTKNNLFGEIATTNQELVTTLGESKTNFANSITETAASLKEKVSTAGGDINGSLVLSGSKADLTVEGKTTLKNTSPASNDTYDLGESGKGWNNIYAHNLWGSSLLSVGDGSSSHGFNGPDDLLISGGLEVNGLTYLDGATHLSADLIPSSNSVNLGTSSNHFGTVYADNLVGVELNGSDDTKLPLDGGTLTGSILADSTDVDLGSLSDRFGDIYGSNLYVKDSTPELKLIESSKGAEASLKKINSNGQLTLTNEVKVASSSNQSGSFNGYSSHIDMGDSSEKSQWDFGTGSFSLESWVKTTQSGYGNILTYDNASNGGGFIFRVIPGGNVEFQILDQSRNAQTIDSASPINDGSWHHIVAVRDSVAGEIRLHVDNVEANTPVSDGGYNVDGGDGAQLGIGIHGSWVSNFFVGSMDEARVYSKVLTTGEINTHYNGGAGQSGSPETGLVGGWHFNEGSGTTVGDYSGNGYNGTFQVGDSWDAGKVGSSCGVFGSSGNPFGAPLHGSASGSFNGADNILSVGNWDSLNPVHISIVASVYPTESRATEIIGTNGPFGLFLNADNTVTLGIYTGTWEFFATTDTIPLNAWSQLVGTYDGTNLKIYINGVLSASEVHPVPGNMLTSGRVQISGDEFFPEPYGFLFKGKMDEVAVCSEAIDSTTVSNLYSSSDYQNDVSDLPNLVSYWKMDGDWLDSKGSNNGIYSGGNIDNYVSVDNAYSSPLNITGGFTLEAWVQPASVSGTMSLIAKANYVDATNYILRIVDGSVYFEYGDPIQTDSAVLSDGGLYHIVATAESPTGLKSIYVNGVLVKQDTTGGSVGTVSDSLTLGYASNGADYYNGQMDEARVYNRAITEEEIAAHYNSGLGDFGTPESGLVGGWHLDGDSVDYSGNGADGTDSDMAWADGIFTGSGEVQYDTTQTQVLKSEKSGDDIYNIFGDSADKTVIDGRTISFNINGSESASINENGNVVFNGSITGNSLIINGVSTFNDYITVSGNSQFNNDLTVSGTIYSNGVIAFGDSQTFGGATLTELGYLSGATSDIQIQLDDKLDLAGGSLTGDLTINKSDPELLLENGGVSVFKRSAGETIIDSQGIGTYTRTVSIDPVTPEDNYQVKIELTPDNFNYSNSTSDGRDIRFFDGSDPLDYFIETWDTSGTSTIFVKVPTSGTSSIEMKYGDSTLSAQSDGANVFDFFDDFNDGDFNGWTENWPGFSVIDGVLTTQNAENRNDISRDDLNIASDNWAVDARVNRNQDLLALWFGLGRDKFYDGYNSWWTNAYGYGIGLTYDLHKNNSGRDDIATLTTTSSSNYGWMVVGLAKNGSELKGFENGTEIISASDSDYSQPFHTLDIYGYSYPGQFQKIDWVLIRKRAATEPVATLGAETNDGDYPGQMTIENSLGTGLTLDIEANVGIGDATPDTTLKVVGSICAHTDDTDCAGNISGVVYADNFVASGTQLAVPDYVFDPNYNLMPLDQLQTYLTANQHLPDIPSMDQIHTNGLDYSSMLMGLLQKTEENTLYILQNHDQISTINNTLTLNGINDNVDNLQASTENSLSKLKKDIKDVNSQLDNITAQQTADTGIVATLQDQIKQLQAAANQDLTLAKLDANTQDIGLLKLTLGLDRVANTGDVDILGQLSAQTLEAGGLAIKAIDPAAATIGQAIIPAGETSVTVGTTAVDEESKIFVTLREADKIVPLKVGAIIKNENFEVEIENPSDIETTFDWWIIN